MKTKAKKAKVEKQNLDGDAIFERAYILYRKNENARALAEIAKGDQNEARFMELKAQLLYRLEKGEEALELFSKLSEIHSDEYDETRQANIMAVIALLESKGVQKEQLKQQDTFEQMYNRACHLLIQNKHEEAIRLLDRALVKCRETLEEDGLTDEEIQEELSIIKTQKAYAFQESGAIDKAVEIYKSIEKNKISDTNLKAVVLNNLLSLKAQSSDAFGKLRNVSKKPKAKLTQQQKHTIKYNLALLQLQPEEKGKSFEAFVTGKLNKRNRKHKTKLPKNYDPNVPPDPERWLPRQERTAYKKKLNKKFKDRDIGRGTQGAGSSQAAAANIDYSKAPSVEPHPSPKPTAAEGPRQQRPAQQMKKNKKKKGGGKW